MRRKAIKIQIDWSFFFKKKKKQLISKAQRQSILAFSVERLPGGSEALGVPTPEYLQRLPLTPSEPF